MHLVAFGSQGDNVEESEQNGRTNEESFKIQEADRGPKYFVESKSRLKVQSVSLGALPFTRKDALSIVHKLG